jgi:hypothetical protein
VINKRLPFEIRLYKKAWGDKFKINPPGKIWYEINTKSLMREGKLNHILNK